MITTIELDDADRALMQTCVNAIPHEYGGSDFHEFFYNCWRQGGALPARVGVALFDFRVGRSGSALLIKGLPLPPDVPPTPARRGGTWSGATLAARKLMCVTLAQLGHIYNFSSKKDFDYIDDVFPIYSDRDDQVGTNRSFLEWHVEDGFHRAKADLVALLCLRGDAAAQTHLCGARDLALAPHFREQLQRRDFVIRVDTTFEAASQDAAEHLCAVLTAGNDPEIVYDPAFMRGVTPQAQAALDHVRECVALAHQSITLEPGDMLVFDNRRVLHARSSYQPAYNGNDRWLLRALLLESYWKARECLPDLALDPSVLRWPCADEAPLAQEQDA